MTNVLCKAKCGGWKWIILGIIIGGSLILLVGCGTVKGVLTGVEATSAGILQDLRGAVDGIDRADNQGG